MRKKSPPSSPVFSDFSDHEEYLLACAIYQSSQDHTSLSEQSDTDQATTASLAPTAPHQNAREWIAQNLPSKIEALSAQLKINRANRQDRPSLQLATDVEVAATCFSCVLNAEDVDTPNLELQTKKPWENAYSKQDDTLWCLAASKILKNHLNVENTLPAIRQFMDEVLAQLHSNSCNVPTDSPALYILWNAYIELLLEVSLTQPSVEQQKYHQAAMQCFMKHYHAVDVFLVEQRNSEFLKYDLHGLNYGVAMLVTTLAIAQQAVATKQDALQFVVGRHGDDVVKNAVLQVIRGSGFSPENNVQSGQVSLLSSDNVVSYRALSGWINTAVSTINCVQEEHNRRSSISVDEAVGAPYLSVVQDIETLQRQVINAEETDIANVVLLSEHQARCLMIEREIAVLVYAAMESSRELYVYFEEAFHWMLWNQMIHARPGVLKDAELTERYNILGEENRVFEGILIAYQLAALSISREPTARDAVDSQYDKQTEKLANQISNYTTRIKEARAEELELIEKEKYEKVARSPFETWRDRTKKRMAAKKLEEKTKKTQGKNYFSAWEAATKRHISEKAAATRTLQTVGRGYVARKQQALDKRNEQKAEATHYTMFKMAFLLFLGQKKIEIFTKFLFHTLYNTERSTFNVLETYGAIIGGVTYSAIAMHCLYKSYRQGLGIPYVLLIPVALLAGLSLFTAGTVAMYGSFFSSPQNSYGNGPSHDYMLASPKV